MLLFSAAGLFAFPYTTKFSEETEESEDFSQDNGFYNIQTGDQYIKIAMGVTAPLNFPDFESLFHKDKHQLSIGGMGSLGYHYFLNSYLALGFDVSYGFNVTIGSHIFNYVPILFSATYQYSWHKLEFPLTLNAGFCWESYNNHNYFPALIVKPEAGVHYRVDENWSVGVEASWMIMPQFSSWYDKGEDYTGHFMNLSLAARYYF